jgi:hypothetical protein
VKTFEDLKKKTGVFVGVSRRISRENKTRFQSIMIEPPTRKWQGGMNASLMKTSRESSKWSACLCPIRTSLEVIVPPSGPTFRHPAAKWLKRCLGAKNLIGPEDCSEDQSRHVKRHDVQAWNLCVAGDMGHVGEGNKRERGTRNESSK